MKQIYYIFTSLFLVLCLSFNCNAQTNSDSTNPIKKNSIKSETSKQGRLDNTSCNKEQKDSLQGLVKIEFIVEVNGRITNVKIHESSGIKSLDKEALRVAKKMPRWDPTNNNKEKKRIKYIMPIRFTLDDEDEDENGNDDDIPSEANKKKK